MQLNRLQLFAGSEDIVTTIDDCKVVVNQKNNRTLVEFNGNHLQGFQALTAEKYIFEIEQFLGK